MSRYIRWRLEQICGKGVLFAQEPSVVKAWRRGWDAAHFVRLLRWRDAGFKPKLVFDIGAHEGAWSEMCSDILAPQQVVLFEPQIRLHDAVDARRRQSRCGDWKIMPFALGRADSTQLIHVTRNDAAASLLRPVENGAFAASATDLVATREVVVRSLDNVVQADQLGLAELIKIDVQGFESEVIDGGIHTLSQAEKLVVEVSLREIYSGQPLIWEVLRKLTSCQFVVEDITEALREWPSGRLWQVDLWLGRSKRQ